MPKKPKLTKEEKKQMRLEKKRLKKLAKEEKKKQLKRDHLQRETEHGELSLESLKKKWREMLLKIKLPEFRQDLETMWHRFDRVLDLKDYAITCLLEEIKEDELQYNTNLSANVEAMDKAILMFGKRWDELQAWYKQQLADLHATAHDSSTKIANQQEEDTLHLKTMMFGLESQLKEAQYTAEGIYASKTTDEYNKYAEMREILKCTLERSIDDTWSQFKSTLVYYQTSTDPRRKAFLELQVRDRQGGGLVFRQYKKMNYLQNLLQLLKDNLNKENHHQNEVLSDFLYERQYFADAYYKLRNRLKEERELDYSQLIVLTMESNLTVKHLTQVATKGEHILCFAAICRKMETQEEKVTPFPKPFLEDDEEQAIQTEMSQKSSNMMLKVFDDYSGLDQFWRRVAEADLRRAQLLECRNQARAENQLLRNTLKRAMSGLAVTERVSVIQLSQPRRAEAKELPPVLVKTGYSEMKTKYG